MAKKKKQEAEEVSTRFTSPSFRYKGVKYISADVEKAALAGDEDALAIIANLVSIGSGVISAEPVAASHQNEEGGSDE